MIWLIFPNVNRSIFIIMVIRLNNYLIMAESMSYKLIRIYAFLLFSLLFTQKLYADLKVFPTRVLFEGDRRSATVHLKHIGSKETRYRIKAVFYKVGLDGSYSEVKNPSLEKDGFAGKLVRFSPRIVSLKPNVEQIVRIMLRKPRGLKEGEYRAHLHFATFDPQDAEEFLKTKSKGGIVMDLRAQRAVAIPFIIRHGFLHADIKMSQFSLEKNAVGTAFNLDLKMEKDGNRSVYGDFEVSYEGDKGEKKVLGLLRGISIYNKSLKVKIPLSFENKRQLQNKSIKIIFSRENEKKLEKSIKFKSL